MLVKGTVYEDIFRYSDDPTIQKIFNERMLPYMDGTNYPTVIGYLLHFFILII